MKRYSRPATRHLVCIHRENQERKLPKLFPPNHKAASPLGFLRRQAQRIIRVIAHTNISLADFCSDYIWIHLQHASFHKLLFIFYRAPRAKFIKSGIQLMFWNVNWIKLIRFIWNTFQEGQKSNKLYSNPVCFHDQLFTANNVK